LVAVVFSGAEGRAFLGVEFSTEATEDTEGTEKANEAIFFPVRLTVKFIARCALAWEKRGRRDLTTDFADARREEGTEFICENLRHLWLNLFRPL
jgi:hypothetical protein